MKNLTNYLDLVGKGTQVKLVEELRYLFDSGMSHAMAKEKAKELAKLFTKRTLKKACKSMDTESIQKSFIEDTVKEYRYQASEPLDVFDMAPIQDDFLTQSYTIDATYLDALSVDKEEKEEAREMDPLAIVSKELEKLEGVEVEKIGAWLWVRGEKTKEHRQTLKELSLRWSPKRQAWYYFEGIEISKKRKGGGKKTMDEIRAKYKKQA